MDDRVLDKLDQMSSQLARTEANTENLKDYIRAVSSNVKDVRESLDDHERDSEAHGLGASNKQSGNIIAWISVVVALCALLAPLLKQ